MAPQPDTSLHLEPPAQSTLDWVTVRNMRVSTLIGVHPHEREGHQEVRLDAWIGTDTCSAAASDAIEDAIDYSAVAEAFRAHAATRDAQLVETLAEDFARIALDQFGAQAVTISIQKFGAIADADAVGVVIRRSRRPA